MGRIREQRWVFGMLSITNREQGPIFYVVPRRDAGTLLPIIGFHCEMNSTIVSDEWRAYMGITRAGFNHLTVNHSANFVNPLTGKLT